MELVNSVVGNVASYAVNNLAVLNTDGDGRGMATTTVSGGGGCCAR